MPRIPDSTLDGEDRTQGRVCTAKTIEGCFSGMPSSPELSSYYYGHGGYFKLFVICTEKLGLTKIIDSEYLSNNGLVSDAITTGEVWIQESFQVPPENIHIIWISDWNEDTEEDRSNLNKEIKIISDLKYDCPIKHLGTQVNFPLLKDEDGSQFSPLTSELKYLSSYSSPLPGGGAYQVNSYRVQVEKVDLTSVFHERGKLFRSTYSYGGMSIYTIPQT